MTHCKLNLVFASYVQHIIISFNVITELVALATLYLRTSPFYMKVQWTGVLSDILLEEVNKRIVRNRLETLS